MICTPVAVVGKEAVETVKIEGIEVVDGFATARASDTDARACVIGARAFSVDARACSVGARACGIPVVGVLYFVETGAGIEVALLVATLTERGVAGAEIVEWRVSAGPSSVATDLSTVVRASTFEPAALRIDSRTVKGGTS
jgi:hypothetical protein